MNGVHDLGGMQCFGDVRPEPDEPVFHAGWEARTLALTLATGALGGWNIDQSRSARESLPPTTYLGSSYYRIWFEALERSIAAAGLLDGTHDGSARDWPTMASALAAGTSYLRASAAPALFAVGDPVRTRMMHPGGHTRLPRYARDRAATVVAVHGAFVYPDRSAVPIGVQPDGAPEWMYTIEIVGVDLWGPESDPSVCVCLEAWEPYLELAS